MTRLYKSGQYTQANSILRMLANRFPNRADFHGRLAFEMVSTERFRETVEMLNNLAKEFDFK